MLAKIHLLSGEGAVLSFLVISALSISHSITTQPKSFFMRGLDRIYPLYFWRFGRCRCYAHVAPRPNSDDGSVERNLFLNTFFVDRFPAPGPA